MIQMRENKQCTTHCNTPKGYGSYLSRDPGMSLNCAPTRVCRKSASRPGYVVNDGIPGEVMELMVRWTDKLAGGVQVGSSDSLPH